MKTTTEVLATHPMRSLTMTQTNPTGTYTNHTNTFARRDDMRDAAMLMMESLNDAATGTGVRYAVIEAGIDGYQIVELDHPTTWVWYILAI